MSEARSRRARSPCSQPYLIPLPLFPKVLAVFPRSYLALGAYFPFSYDFKPLNCPFIDSGRFGRVARSNFSQIPKLFNMVDVMSGLEAIGKIVQFAVWLSKVENAPDEVSRCMELVESIWQNIQYLIQLRNEKAETLKQMAPRELNRIDNLIVTAKRAIQDIGTVLEK